MREIEIYSTKNGYKTILSEAKTWGELIVELRNNSYDTIGQIATESINRTVLEKNEQSLPQGNFKIFLRQKDGKGGFNSEGKINT
jgi:hypothetical protein